MVKRLAAYFLRKGLVALIICTSILFMFLPIHAQEVRLVTVDNFPPYTYREDTKLKGFNIVLLREVFKRMDIQLSIETVPWARGIRLVQTGKVDGIFPLLKTKDRHLFFNFSIPYTIEPMALFVLSKSKIEWKGELDQVRKYTFGRVREYSSGTLFDEFASSDSNKIQLAVNTRSNILKLLKGRFDIMIENQYVVLYELEKMGKTDSVRMLEPLIQINPAHIGFSKSLNNKDLLKKFNSTLRHMKTDGSYEQIITNYFINTKMPLNFDDLYL